LRTLDCEVQCASSSAGNVSTKDDLDCSVG
jgi:hypothetical protein